MADQKRPYRMKKRADLQEQTRRRITESTVDLHEKLGPARTSISAVAQHAGVRRSTVYRHFPDEAALFEACTAHWMDANPLPDLTRWAAVEDPARRLGCALIELYAYYRRTERMLDHLMRDEALNATVKHLFGGFRRFLDTARDTLMAGRRTQGEPRRGVEAAVGHALAFTTWRSLTHDQELEDVDAAELMCRLVATAAGGSRAGRGGGARARARALTSAAPASTRSGRG
jgi:AcrR family transcriptional regulator